MFKESLGKRDHSLTLMDNCVNYYLKKKGIRISDTIHLDVIKIIFFALNCIRIYLLIDSFLFLGISKWMILLLGRLH